MSTGLMFVIIGVILFFIVWYNKMIDVNKFFSDARGLFMFLMEDDYKFYLTMKYGDKVNVYDMFEKRSRDAIIAMALFTLIFWTRMSYIYIIVIIIIGYLVFKSQYASLKSYYKKNLNSINLLLPYYLKSLEILIQHYTVPVAIAKSIDSAPDIFKPGLRRLVARIEDGDSSVEPYMDFAKEYPVRDSMSMMRLLYRLSLGAQENKQEQLLAFGRTVSSLQNKSREYKYKERLDNMEKRTMIMLAATGGGIMGIMLFAMMMLMNF